MWNWILRNLIRTPEVNMWADEIEEIRRELARFGH